MLAARLSALPVSLARGTSAKFASRRTAVAAQRSSVRAMASFHDFKGKTLGGGTRAAPTDGSEFDFAQLKGKIVLINNVATFWGTTVRDFIQLNALADKYPDKLAILGFPCNQFGHQCYDSDFELMHTLKHVRPGDGYVPNFQIMAKCEVNGEGEEPLWTYLKSTIPAPSDDRGGTGSDFIYQIQPNSMPIQWSPVRRSDITWNFEKFLINQDGKPVKRYSPKFENANIVADIEALLKDPDASM